MNAPFPVRWPEVKTHLDDLASKDNKLDLIVSTHERNMIVAGLRLLRNEMRRAIRRDDRAGWKPEPGHVNVNAMKLATTERLLAKYADRGEG